MEPQLVLELDDVGESMGAMTPGCTPTLMTYRGEPWLIRSRRNGRKHVAEGRWERVNGSARFVAEEWDEEKHPRGHEGNPGQFAHKEVADAKTNAPEKAVPDARDVLSYDQFRAYLVENRENWSLSDRQIDDIMWKYAKSGVRDRLETMEASGYPTKLDTTPVDNALRGDPATEPARLLPSRDDVDAIRAGKIAIGPDDTIFVRHQTTPNWEREFPEVGIDTRDAPPDSRLGMVTVTPDGGMKQSRITTPGLYVEPNTGSTSGGPYGVIIQTTPKQLSLSLEAGELGNKTGLEGLYNSGDAIIVGQVIPPESIVGVYTWENGGAVWRPNPRNPNSGMFRVGPDNGLELVPTGQAGKVGESAGLLPGTDWDETEHPRGQPENAGQFVAKGQGAAPAVAPETVKPASGGNGKPGQEAPKTGVCPTCGRPFGKSSPDGQNAPEPLKLNGKQSEIKMEGGKWQFRPVGKGFWHVASPETAAEIERQLSGRSGAKPAPAAKPVEAPAEPSAKEPWNGGDITRGHVYNIPTEQLAVDASRFQFKLHTDKAGVTDKLKSVTVWNPNFAGVLAVWRDPADGKTYVVNGHHRLELATRLQVKDLAIRYIEAKNAQMARAEGALVNMAEGQGTAVDAAKFLRDTNTTLADLKARGVSVKGQLAVDAVALTALSDRSFTRVVQGLLEKDIAVAVASRVKEPELQDQLFRLLEKREEDGKETPLKVITEMAKEMAETPKVEATDEGGMLPGFEKIDSEESLFVPRNELKALVRADLNREVRDFLAVASKRRAAAVAGAGNVLNLDENRKIADEAERIVSVYDSLVNMRGAISDALNAGAEKFRKARTKKDRSDVRQATKEAVRSAVFREAGIVPAERGRVGPSVPGGAGVPENERGDEAEGTAENTGRKAVGESRVGTAAGWHRLNGVLRFVAEGRWKDLYPQTGAGSAVDLPTAIRLAAAHTDTLLTDEQRKSGRYAKGHVTVQGLDIAIENPKGSFREGTDPDGHRWCTQLAWDYGYIARAGGKAPKGADGDAVDVFLGPHPEAELVFVVDQVDEGGEFDEHKVMVGFLTKADAVDGYLANYEAGWECGPITAMTMPQFKAWLKSGDRRPARKWASARRMAESAARIGATVLESEWDEEEHPRDREGQFAHKGTVGLVGQDGGTVPPVPAPEMPLDADIAVNPGEFPAGSSAEYWLKHPEHELFGNECAAMVYVTPPDKVDRLEAMLVKQRPNQVDLIRRQVALAKMAAKNEWSAPDGSPLPLIAATFNAHPESIDHDRLRHFFWLVGDDQRDAIATLARFKTRLGSTTVETLLSGVRQQEASSSGAAAFLRYDPIDREYVWDRATERRAAVDAMLPRKIGKRVATQVHWQARNADWTGRATVIDGALQVEDPDGFLRRASVVDGKLVATGQPTGVLSPRWQDQRRRLTMLLQQGKRSQYAGELAALGGVEFAAYDRFMYPERAKNPPTKEQIDALIAEFEPGWLKQPDMRSVPPVNDWVPVQTLREAEDQIAKLGIRCRWRVGETPAEKYPNRFRYSIDDVNAACARFVELTQQYPEVSVRSFGARFALDTAHNLRSYGANCRKEEAAGGTIKQIETRVRKRGGSANGPDPDDHDYGDFGSGASWCGGEIQMNEAQIPDTPIRAQNLRTARLEHGSRLDLCSTSVSATVDHEFGHALDHTYDFTDDDEVAAKLQAYPDEELERGLSTYANARAGDWDDARRNIRETWAEAFSESRLPDARPMGVEIAAMFAEFRKWMGGR